MIRVITAHLHALHKKFSLVVPTIGFGQNIVNGNEPQRAAQAKNGPKTPENAVFGPFLTQNRDFRPPNRPFSAFRPVFRRISHTKAQSPQAACCHSVAPSRTWRLGVRRLPDFRPKTTTDCTDGTDGRGKRPEQPALRMKRISRMGNGNQVLDFSGRLPSPFASFAGKPAVSAPIGDVRPPAGLFAILRAAGWSRRRNRTIPAPPPAAVRSGRGRRR